MKIDDYTEISDVLYNADEEMAIIIPKSDGTYNIQCKKRLLNNDGSDAGWLYTDVPNVRLDEYDKYVIESPKEDEIGNRSERRYGNNGKSNEKRKNKTTAN